MSTATPLESTVPPVTLSGSGLSIAEVVRVARHGALVRLSTDASDAIDACSDALEHHLSAIPPKPIYGLTTGVGSLDGVPVSREDNQRLQRNLLRSHAAGVGAAMPEDQVRAMMVTRANVLARGMSGVQRRTIEALIALLNCGVTPVVPEAGSVGASDLAPLAHMSLVLVGEGMAHFDGSVVAGRTALERAGITPAVLSGRDALGLINGLNQTVGIGTLAAYDAVRLVAIGEVAAAMTLAANDSPRDFLDARLASSKAHAGTIESAARLRALIGEASIPVGPAIRSDLSTRYAPSVFGASRDAIALCKRVLTTEMNAVVDNPLFLDRFELTNNAGVTSGQELGQALDFMATSLISLAVISERRTANLLDVHHNGGLPAFLLPASARPGLSHGLMLAQYTAAALVAELRTQAVPTSIQSLPTCAGTEDHVSMSALAARRAQRFVTTAELVVAIELLVAAQAIDLRGRVPAGLRPFHQRIRAEVPMVVEDRVVGDDISAIATMIRSGRFDDLAPEDEVRSLCL